MNVDRLNITHTWDFSLAWLIRNFVLPSLVGNHVDFQLICRRNDQDVVLVHTFGVIIVIDYADKCLYASGFSCNVIRCPGVWPINPERMTERSEWIRRYEHRAKDFASCRFEEDLGSVHVDRKCEKVRAVHDKYCKADLNLPLA